MKQTPKTTISSQLLDELKTLTNKKRFKSLYQISEYLKEEKPDIIIFDYIGIISYAENPLAYKGFTELIIPNFRKEMNRIQYDILTLFIDYVKNKKYIDNIYVTDSILQIFDKIPKKSIMRKYFAMVEPLIKDKINEDRAKIKLLIVNPINFERLYKEISASYFSFPSNVKDFYSNANLEMNTSNIKNFVEKTEKEKLNNNGMNKMLNGLKNEFNEMKQVLNATFARFDKVENKLIEKEQVLNTTLARLDKVENKLIEMEKDIENLKDDLYKINLRESIKDFIDDLLWSFNIYIENANISTKINEIKKKIRILIKELQNEEQKYAIFLIDFLDYLYDKLQKGNDLSHYFNNIGFKKENLPDKIKQRFSEFSNGDQKYNYVSLVLASYDSDKIQVKESTILNKVIKTIIGFDKKDGEKRTRDIVNCFKLYSKY